jgi:hypothetical protein
MVIGQSSSSIKGLVMDEKTKEPLPYANIFVLHQYTGTVSNETGTFSLSSANLSDDDSISFQYIGYQTKTIVVKDLDSIVIIPMKEEVINLSETFVYGNPPNPKDIIKKVVENREKNYRQFSSKDQVFIRSRSKSDIEKLTTDLKKNSISQLDEELINNAISKVPRHITSFTDFLGDLYFLADQKDSLKVAPMRTVSLKEEDIAELEQFGRIFEKMFKDTDEEEYWKIKSGILGQKLDIENDSIHDSSNDTIAESNTDNDSTQIRYFASRIKNWLKFAQLEDTKEWEFLYDTGKYKYKLLGGSRVNSEDVYMIDFTPKSGGEYIGRAYISTTTYALIRADYVYAEGKTGRDIHMFGIGYTEDAFKASIYFENHEGNYRLKYISKKAGNQVSFDRNVALIKKRKRWLLDKTLLEIKVNLDFAIKVEESVEFLFLEHQSINDTQFNQFQQAKKMKIQYIEQFTDELWKDYPIIEPTKTMREYKKQNIDW